MLSLSLSKAWAPNSPRIYLLCNLGKPSSIIAYIDPAWLEKYISLRIITSSNCYFDSLFLVFRKLFPRKPVLTEILLPSAQKILSSMILTHHFSFQCSLSALHYSNKPRTTHQSIIEVLHLLIITILLAKYKLWSFRLLRLFFFQC